MTRAKCMAGALAAACALSALASAQPAGEAPPDVAGVTLDSKGDALRKVNLTLYPLAAGDPLPPYSAISERDGRFGFFGVAPGRYRLEAERAGYLRTRFGAQNTWAPGRALTVRAGQPLTGIEVRMTEQSTIAGAILHDEGTGTVAVALLRQGYQDGRRSLTTFQAAMANESGEFSFNKLAPGRYYLAAYSPQSNPGAIERYVYTYYPGTIDLSAAEAIDLKKGAALSGLQFPLRKSPVFRVSGSVDGYTGAPGRVSVSLRPVTQFLNFYSAYYPVAENGTFELGSVLPGSYWITASLGSTALTIAPQAVEVSASDVAGIVLKAEPPVKLRGSVTVEGGPAAPGLVMRLEPANGIGTSPTTGVNADGSFALSVPPGRYRVDIQGLPAGAYLKSVALGEKDALGGLDVNQAAGDSKLAVVICRAGGSVAGTVRDAAGKPATGTVTLIPDPPQPGQPALYQVAETGEDGGFQLQGIRPGKYRLYAWEELEPGAHLDAQFTATLQPWSEALEVAEGDRKEATLRRIPVETTDAANRTPAR